MGALGNDENATQVLQKALLHAPQKVGLGVLVSFCAEMRCIYCGGVCLCRVVRKHLLRDQIRVR